MTRQRIGIVLAAGKGTRLKSDVTKVLHPILGKPMIQRVLEQLVPADLDRVILVVGHQSDAVRAHVQELDLPFSLDCVVQEPQLGTGHAVMQVLPKLPENTEADVLITCGDMPLIPSGRYQSLLKILEGQVSLTMATVSLPDPSGYGRVVRDAEGHVSRIVEDKDASPQETSIPWINVGVYAGAWEKIAPCLGKLSDDNAQGEFYFTDVVEMLIASGQQVGVSEWPDPDEVIGINSRQQLAEATAVLSRWTVDQLMADGVTVVQPHMVTIAPEVQIGSDSVIHPGCYLEGDVHIGTHCEIGPYTTMRGHVSIGEHTRVLQSMLERNVVVGAHTYVGPFAHLRDEASVGDQTRIGNFVEVKATQFGSRSNAAHLCYVGDATVGDDVNMGAGSIVANYDPIRDTKHHTAIQDGVKVGCNSVLVAPVTLESGACVAAGSVITDTVNTQDLAIARCRQTTVPQWVTKTLSQKTPSP